MNNMLTVVMPQPETPISFAPVREHLSFEAWLLERPELWRAGSAIQEEVFRLWQKEETDV